MPLGEPGDERAGLEVHVTPAGGLAQNVVVLSIMIRKDRFLQMLIGGGLEVAEEGFEPGWDTMAQVGNAVDPRWPSEDAWDMVPEAADVPAGLAIAEEREVLPGE